MKLAVASHPTVPRRCALQLFKQLLEAPEVVCIRQLSRPARCQRLQSHTNRVNLTQISHGRLEHGDAPLVTDQDPLGPQPRDRLPEWGAAYPQTGRQLRLAQRLPPAQLT